MLCSFFLYEDRISGGLDRGSYIGYGIDARKGQRQPGYKANPFDRANYKGGTENKGSGRQDHHKHRSAPYPDNAKPEKMPSLIAGRVFRLQNGALISTQTIFPSLPVDLQLLFFIGNKPQRHENQTYDGYWIDDNI